MLGENIQHPVEECLQTKGSSNSSFLTRTPVPTGQQRAVGELLSIQMPSHNLVLPCHPMLKVGGRVESWEWSRVGPPLSPGGFFCPVPHHYHHHLLVVFLWAQTPSFSWDPSWKLRASVGGEKQHLPRQQPAVEQSKEQGGDWPRPQPRGGGCCLNHPPFFSTQTMRKINIQTSFQPDLESLCLFFFFKCCSK